MRRPVLPYPPGDRIVFFRACFHAFYFGSGGEGGIGVGGGLALAHQPQVQRLPVELAKLEVVHGHLEGAQQDISGLNV